MEFFPQATKYNFNWWTNKDIMAIPELLHLSGHGFYTSVHYEIQQHTTVRTAKNRKL